MCNKVLGSVLLSAVTLKRELLSSSQFFLKTLKTDDRFHDNFFNNNFFNDNFFNDNPHVWVPGQSLGLRFLSEASSSIAYNWPISLQIDACLRVRATSFTRPGISAVH